MQAGYWHEKGKELKQADDMEEAITI